MERSNETKTSSLELWKDIYAFTARSYVWKRSRVTYGKKVAFFKICFLPNPNPLCDLSLSCTSFCHVPLLEFQVHFPNIHFSATTQVHLNDSTSLDVKLFCSYRKKILLPRKLFTSSFSELPCKFIQQKDPYLLFSPRPESTV